MQTDNMYYIGTRTTHSLDLDKPSLEFAPTVLLLIYRNARVAEGTSAEGASRKRRMCDPDRGTSAVQEQNTGLKYAYLQVITLFTKICRLSFSERKSTT